MQEKEIYRSGNILAFCLQFPMSQDERMTCQKSGTGEADKTTQLSAITSCINTRDLMTKTWYKMKEQQLD